VTSASADPASDPLPDPEEPKEGSGELPSLDEAEARAAELRTAEEPLGRPGRPLNSRSPFMIGLFASAGVAVTALVVELVIVAKDVLVLMGLALVIAIGLEPAVAWLGRRRVPRWAGVTVVILAVLGAFGGFLSIAIPQIVTQATTFATQVPTILQDLQDRNSFLGDLNQRFDIVANVQSLLSSGGLSLFNGILGASAVVLDVLSSTLIVVVLIIYFLGDLPRIRRGMYRAMPSSRRPRFILIADEIFAKVGAYVLGIIVLAIIAGTSSLVFLAIAGFQTALLLAFMVALLDVIPVVGTTFAGVVITLIGFSMSTTTGIATAVFFVVYRLVEDYILTPRIIGRAVKVPALLTVLALLLGGVLLGVIGAVVAIPIAAALLIIARSTIVPRLDAT
jgi:predicted PurR-regulated permease PerM